MHDFLPIYFQIQIFSLCVLSIWNWHLQIVFVHSQHYILSVCSFDKYICKLCLFTTNIIFYLWVHLISDVCKLCSFDNWQIFKQNYFLEIFCSFSYEIECQNIFIKIPWYNKAVSFCQIQNFNEHCIKNPKSIYCYNSWTYTRTHALSFSSHVCD